MYLLKRVPLLAHPKLRNHNMKGSKCEQYLPKMIKRKYANEAKFEHECRIHKQSLEVECVKTSKNLKNSF